MADLTDLTITPMIPIGIGVTSVLLARTTDWNVGIVLIIGFVLGAPLGFLAGFLLYVFLNSTLTAFDKVRKKRKQRRDNARRGDKPN